MRAARLVLTTAVALAVGASPALADHKFNTSSGFVGRTPVRVWKPDAWEVKLNVALNNWNTLVPSGALFDRVFVRGNADVVLRHDDPAGQGGSYTACSPDRWSPYTSCYVQLLMTGATLHARKVLEHELGHTLGFDDHGFSDTSYCGVMAYFIAEDSTCWLGSEDRTMLVNGGY